MSEMSARVADSERSYIIEGANLNVRTDGRGVLDVRHVIAQCGVIEHCNGSVLVSRVHTSEKILCGIKIQTVDLLSGDVCFGQTTSGNSKTSDFDVNNVATNIRGSLKCNPFFDVSIDCGVLESQRDNTVVKHLQNYSKHGEALIREQLEEMLADGRDQFLFIVPGKIAWKIFGMFK